MRRVSKIVVLLVLLIMLSYQVIIRFGILFNNKYQNFAIKEIGSSEWTNFDLFVSSSFYESTKQYQISYYFGPGQKSLYFMEMDTIPKRIVLLTKDSLRVVDYISKELSGFRKGISRYQGTWYWLFKDELFSKMRFLPYYTSCLPISMRPNDKNYTMITTKIIDTTVLNIKSKVIVGRTIRHNEYNEKTNSFDIPCHYEISTWINHDSFEVDSVIAILKGKDVPKKSIRYKVENVNHNDMRYYYDSIFDFSNSFYGDFTIHDDTYPPLSRIVYSGSDNIKELLEFPIVSLEQDTLSLLKEPNWILLDLWSFNCHNCIKAINLFGVEKDSIGCYCLEKHGIKIFSVNYASDNMDLIQKIANKTNTTDILYSAKGLNTLVNIPALGYYYLFSPTKEIVYESSNLGDYSELLKAKADWEKQHQKD